MNSKPTLAVWLAVASIFLQGLAFVVDAYPTPVVMKFRVATLTCIVLGLGANVAGLSLSMTRDGIDKAGLGCNVAVLSVMGTCVGVAFLALWARV